MKSHLLLQGTAFGSLLSLGCFSTVAVANRNYTPDSKSSAANGTGVSQQLTANTLSVETVTQSVFNQINRYRQKKGLAPLKLNALLSQQAIAHSQAMAVKKVGFGHQGFEQRAKAISKSIPYRSIAENVAYNMGYKDPATQAVQGWIKSNGHRKNIEGNHTFTGIGIAKNAVGEYYFTQIFIRPR